MVANIITPQGATSRIDVRIEQIQASDVFVMPFTLRINKADGSHEDVVVQNTHRDQYFVLTGPADAVSVLYDPDEWILRDLYLGTITDAPPAAAALDLKAFPNPFNPSTTLALVLPTSGPVRLDIFDARGHRVCSVLDEHLEAGRHEVSWQGRDHRERPVAAGTYYARVEAEGVTSVRSLSLVK